MHDALGPGASRKGCENTVELLEGLVAAASEEQLGISPLSLQSADVATPASESALIPDLAGAERGR